MNYHQDWRENMLRDSFKDRAKLKEIIENEKLLYQNVFAINSDDDFCRGFFIEIYKKKGLNELIILLATYVSSHAHSSTTLRAIKSIKNINENRSFTVQIDGFLYGIDSLSIQIKQRIDLSKMLWSLESIEATLYGSIHMSYNKRFYRFWDTTYWVHTLLREFNYRKAIKVWHKKYFDNSSRRTKNYKAKIVCPHCYGRKEWLTFGIPKSAFKEGLSGYELYQSNTVNGAKACTTCGGHEVRFLEWYLNENPDKLNSKNYKKGSGFVTSEMMPTVAGLQ